jgi:hypothetical protein
MMVRGSCEVPQMAPLELCTPGAVLSFASFDTLLASEPVARGKE